MALMVPRKISKYSPKMYKKTSIDIEIAKYMKNIFIKLFKPNDVFQLEMKWGDKAP